LGGGFFFIAANTKGIQHVIVIRDYAYPASHPMHRGIPMSPIMQSTRPVSEVSLSSSEFTGRQAKALYDFEPETESECAMRAGDIIWVQYRQCQVSLKDPAGQPAHQMCKQHGQNGNINGWIKFY
jgi:hypothetical protein